MRIDNKGGAKMRSPAIRPHSFTYLVAEGIDAVSVDEGYVVYDEEHAAIIYLNQTAAAVFEMCDGKTDPREMARIIMNACQLPAPPDGDVEACLEQLLERNLIRPVGDKVQL